MAHTQGTTPRLQRLSALVAIALVAIAVGFAFGRILVGHGATYRMIAVGLASGVLAWATERRGMLLATLVSAAALLLAVTWLAVPHATWHALPTLTTVRSLGTLATLVGQQAREYVSPAPATPALVMAGAIAVWAAVFSCYALAFRAQSPLLALVPPLALVVFADSVLDDVTKPVYGVLFLVAALAVLFADSLRRIRAWGPVWSPVAGHDRLLPVAGSNARRVGATALMVAALAPAVRARVRHDLCPGHLAVRERQPDPGQPPRPDGRDPARYRGPQPAVLRGAGVLEPAVLLADGGAGHVRREHLGGTGR